MKTFIYDYDFIFSFSSVNFSLFEPLPLGANVFMIIMLLKRNDFLFKVIYYEIFLILLFIKKYSSLSLVARSFLMSTLCDMNAVILVLSEKAMAPHSSTLAWKIPWTEEPGKLQSMRSLSRT